MFVKVFVECLNCAYWVDTSGFLAAIHEDIGKGYELGECLSILEGFESLIDFSDMSAEFVEICYKNHFDEVVNDWLYSIYFDVIDNPNCVVEDYNITEVYQFYNFLNNYALR